MIIGAMNHPHKEILDQIYKIGEMNFDYLEITIEYPAATPQKLIQKKDKILEAISSYNLGVLAHLPWFFPLANPYERIQNATNKEIENAMHIATLLGAKTITIHPDLVTPVSVQGRKLMLENTTKTLDYLSKQAKKFGLELCLETVDQKALDVEEYKKILANLDIYITLDIGHLSTYFSIDLEDFIKIFKDKIKHIHLHDFKGSEDHLPLGAGRLELDKVVAALKKFYNNTITLEVHSSDPHYLVYSKEALELAWYGKKALEENKKYYGVKD